MFDSLDQCRQAEPYLRQALATRIEKFGPTHAVTQLTAGALAELLEKTNRADEAKGLRAKHIQPTTQPTTRP